MGLAGQQAGGEQLPRIRGGEVDEVDAVGPQVLNQCVGVGAHLVADHVQLVAVGQQQQFLPGCVEGE